MTESQDFWSTFMNLRLEFDKTDPKYVFWMASEIPSERYVIYCKNKDTLRKASRVLTYREVADGSEGTISFMTSSLMRALKDQVALMEDPNNFVQVFEEVATEAEQVYPGIDLKLIAADYPWTYRIIVKMDAYTHNRLIMPSQLVEMSQTYKEFLQEEIGTAMRQWMNRQVYGKWL